MVRLLLLFTIVPTVEIFLLLQLGSLMGPTATFLLVLLTGLLGAYLAKREGLGLLSQLAQELQQGLPPGTRLMEGGLVIIGGVLLVTPGVMTDVVGLSLIIPFTRRRIAPVALRALARRFQLEVTTGPEARTRDYDPRRHRPSHEGDEHKTPFSNPFDD